MVWLYVAAGGALGSVIRYGLVEWVYSMTTRAFPVGILAVNILGSFLIGLIAVLLFSRHLDPWWQSAMIVGFLGGFTTFSSFSLDTVRLLQAGQIAAALFYIGLSVALCLLATALGWWLGSMFH